MLTFKGTFSRLVPRVKRERHRDSLTVCSLTRLETRLLVKIVLVCTASA